MAEKHPAVVFRKVLAVVSGLLVACMTTIMVTTFVIRALRGDLHHSDFFGIWSWARFEIEHPAALIYDHAAQYAFLLSLDPTFPVPMPFPYPPLYLLLIRPLGWLSYPVAQALWSTTTFLAYMVAVCAPGWRLRILAPALLGTATAVNLVFGQNGFLTAALLVGGIRWAPSWPVAGGILLGLLAYKPQFGFLVVIALVSARLWRTALVAGFTVVAAVMASLFAFGLESWTAWVSAMPDFVAIVDSRRPRVLYSMPTAFANMLALGASDRLAEAIQFAATAAAIASVWFAFKRAPAARYSSTFSPAFGQGNGQGAADRTAVLATASILASPYAFFYDMTLVAAAVALIVAEYWTTLSAVEVLVLGVAALLPACMMLDTIPPISATVHGFLLALILLRCRRAAYRSGRGVDRLVAAGS
jgi:hypothetical protein